MVLLHSGCVGVPATNIPSTLDASGLAAANIAELWWILFGLGTVVFVVVTGLLLYIIFARRQRLYDDEVDLRPVDLNTSQRSRCQTSPYKTPLGERCPFLGDFDDALLAR